MNTYKETPVLIRRALAYGLTIKPYQWHNVMKQYDLKKIPDDVLEEINEPTLKSYIEGLYYSGCEDAGDWTKGHDILKFHCAFKEVERRKGHRVFISLEYQGV